MRVTLLGTGSPEANPRRASSGYLVEAGPDTILLDCGGGVFDRLVQSGRKSSDITHIFFSHLHSDHMMDYARLIYAAWDEGAGAIKVFGPPPIAAITEKLFGRDGVFSTDLVARTESVGSQQVWVARGGSLPRPWPAPEVVEIEPGFSFTGDGWKLTSCYVPHAQPQLICMGFKLETERATLVYSGDAALCNNLENLSKGVDLLIHWCYRLSHEEHHPFIMKMSPSPAQVGQLAERAQVKRLILTHFRTHMDIDENHARAIQELTENFSGESTIAEDLMVVDLG